MTSYNRLVLESTPLHTEKPEWAKDAPKQVAAACRRGAHIIGLTETRGPTLDEMHAVAAGYGYRWYGPNPDAHRNTSLLVKRGLDVTDHGAEVVFNNYMTHVTFTFHGSQITVFEMHWEGTPTSYEVQSNALIEAMKEASAGERLAFYMGDSNPDKPQRQKGSQPNATMNEARMPTIWDELRTYPKGIGVNVIGRNLADGRVKALSGTTHDALGSDHIPATARYRIRRLAA